MHTTKGMKKSHLFHLLGVSIVIFWLVLMGTLIRKIHFQDFPGSGSRQASAGTAPAHEREWREIYLKEKKVGYSVSILRPFEQGYYIQEEIFLRMNLMGLPSGIHTVTQCQVDRDFLLKSFNFSMASGAVTFNASGRMDETDLLVETGTGKEKRTQKIRLPRRPMMGAGLGPFFKSRGLLEVGQTFSMPIFDPSTLSQKDATIRVVAQEPIRINRRRFDAYRLETQLWGKTLTFWLDADGTTLREDGFMGLTAIKSSAANAPRNLEVGDDVDFYEMTAVQADRNLHNPMRSRRLKIVIEGLDEKHFPRAMMASDRQVFAGDVLEIRREAFPEDASYALPFEDADGKMVAFLMPEFNMESDDREVVRQAREIAGDDTNPVSVAKKMLTWVYQHLEKKPVVSVPSAVEVLRTRVGDCNEHATLLATLLRAVKIPSRISIGLVYTKGKFFYHAWTEAYVGQWLTMDATLNEMPADATHIKFLEGNLDKQVEILGLIDSIRVRVLDYQYD